MANFNHPISPDDKDSRQGQFGSSRTIPQFASACGASTDALGLLLGRCVGRCGGACTLARRVCAPGLMVCTPPLRVCTLFHLLCRAAKPLTCGNAIAHRVSSLQLRTYRWGGCTHPRHPWPSAHDLDAQVHTSRAFSVFWDDIRMDVYTVLIAPAVSVSAVRTFCSILCLLRQNNPFVCTRRTVQAGSIFVTYTFSIDLRLSANGEPTVCTESSSPGQLIDACVHVLLNTR